jgi:hypothetical protein
MAVLVLTVETVSTKVTTAEQPSGLALRWQTAACSTVDRREVRRTIPRVTRE